MEKYKRFRKEINGDNEIQIFLDEITTNGWNIIYYNETIEDINTIIITVVCKKSQSIVL